MNLGSRLGPGASASTFLIFLSDDMLSDDLVDELTEAATACDTARENLQSALDAAEAEEDPDEKQLQAIGTDLENWRDAQRQFMAAVEASDVSDVSTAAMLLKTNHGVESMEARRGLPGVHVDGADQPFDVDMSGTRGSLLTTAAMEYVSA